jgi:cytosine/adenosine deaminase-related metal-dependent hydrolase
MGKGITREVRTVTQGAIVFRVSIHRNAKGRWTWTVHAYGPADFETSDDAKEAALRALDETLRVGRRKA